jgi:tyrosyl-tRNA synthetase
MAISRSGAFGLTVPLLTTSDGAKIGKSAGNVTSISLDSLSLSIRDALR